MFSINITLTNPMLTKMLFKTITDHISADFAKNFINNITFTIINKDYTQYIISEIEIFKQTEIYKKIKKTINNNSALLISDKYAIIDSFNRIINNNTLFYNEDCISLIKQKADRNIIDIIDKTQKITIANNGTPINGIIYKDITKTYYPYLRICRIIHPPILEKIDNLFYYNIEDLNKEYFNNKEIFIEKYYYNIKQSKSMVILK